MDRKDVYKLIDGEREHQDRREQSPGQRTAGEEILLLNAYVHSAVMAWTQYIGDDMALEEVRKIAALCVRCMENHEAKAR